MRGVEGIRDLRTKLARSDLSRKAKAVGHYLLSLMLKFARANCWPCHKRIARATGYSVSSVQRGLGELRAAGWLCQRQQKTRASLACRRLVSNLYWLSGKVLGSVKMTERKLIEERKPTRKSAEEGGLQPLVVSSRLLHSALVRRKAY